MNAPQVSKTHGATHAHIMPLNLYFTLGGTLLVLIGFAVWVATVDFGSWNMIIIMTAATIQASIVVLFFMHILYDNKFFGAILFISLLALASFIVFTMLDNGNRPAINGNHMEEINKRGKIYEEKPATAPTATPQKH